MSGSVKWSVMGGGRRVHGFKTDVEVGTRSVKGEPGYSL